MFAELVRYAESLDERIRDPRRLQGRSLLAYCAQLRIAEDMRQSEERDRPMPSQPSPEVQSLLDEAALLMQESNKLSDDKERHRFCSNCRTELNQPLGADLYYGDEESYCDSCVDEYEGYCFHDVGFEMAIRDGEIQLPEVEDGESLSVFLHRCRNDHTNYLGLIDGDEYTNLDALAFNLGVREAIDVSILSELLSRSLEINDDF